MKKLVFTKFLALGSLSLLMLQACKKDGTLVTTNGGTPGTLSANASTLVLDKTKLTDTTNVVNFNFTSANYGFSAAVTNTLQIDAVSDNWAKPTSVTLPTKASKLGYTTADFNNLLLKLNLPAGTPSQIQVRVVHTVSTSVAPIYTNIISMTVTPFNLTSWIYVPGDYQGWNINNPDSLVSVTGNGIYTGIINFPAGGTLQFKITPKKTWTNSYGSNDNSTIIYNGGGNITTPKSGQVLVTVNLNNNTISFAAADFYSVIGDGAQGWGTDVPMKYINDGSGTWTVTTALVSTGSIKVRQDAAWTWSWGIPKAGSEGDGVPNTLNDSSNNNIPVPSSGNYKVSFVMPLTVYGTKPAVTTTYSLVKQ